jgi:hypothetical protein
MSQGGSFDMMIGATCGEHADAAVADRDFGAGDLRGGDAAHLAHALLQRMCAVDAGMHRTTLPSLGVARTSVAGTANVFGGDYGRQLSTLSRPPPAHGRAELDEFVDSLLCLIRENLPQPISDSSRRQVCALLA